MKKRETKLSTEMSQFLVGTAAVAAGSAVFNVSKWAINKIAHETSEPVQPVMAIPVPVTGAQNNNSSTE